MENTEQSVRLIWDMMKRSNVYVIRILEEEREWYGGIFKRDIARESLENSERLQEEKAII